MKIMKKTTLLVLLVVICACNKKVVELPEISHSDITEIQDVSAAYLFYDETQPDSVLLNRKNLISTTNWLVNVDKRLTLKQVIPHIQFLQEKKANAGHKNEHAKNYFTCHDTSRNNLGFVEFTGINFHEEEFRDYFKKSKYADTYMQSISAEIVSNDSIVISFATGKCGFIHYDNTENIINGIKSNLLTQEKVSLHILYSKKLSFQDYISVKSKLSKLNIENVTISKDEFIY